MGRKKNQEEKKIKILEALHKCLQEKPFDQTSIKEIAKTAGVNHGLLHYYFKNKEDILLRYIDYVLSGYKSDFRAWFQSSITDMADKDRFVENIFSYVINKITLNKELSIVFIEIWEIAIYNQKVKLKLQQTYEEWIYTLTDILKSFNKDADNIIHISAAIVAFLEGMALFSVILDPEKIDFRKVISSFKTIIMEQM